LRKKNACLSETSLHFLATENKINFRIIWRSESIPAIYTFSYSIL